ncbi:MAG: biopolymer transport protein TolR [Glaciecola sp.]|jgi:biopolymer transport protein TolR|uniref:Tol-Pal system protein TolR n=1 Tax=Paraglaciecola psychrophila 170 TaxID=1129794 RepID=K7A4B4_9ALTE|nr:protein TolR [Paraglaciecola psychrophila]AGH46152.1 biopolymer transport protein ExbD/TolR [Paraglaciecola psychrophila 170]GAC35713.1 biopolymer transport protein TolR [Paraglaciecola psychrophila 170]
MYVRKRRRPVSEINVVPYIDVMLVLLIIFMVTAPLVTQGVKVDLPKAEAQPLEEESKPPLVASVDAKGQYFLNVGDSQQEPMSAVDLATLVAAHLQVEPGTPVVVKGDGAVAYSQVVQLMVLLQRAGAPSVGLMTTPPEG